MPPSQPPEVVPPREEKAAAVRRMFSAIAPRYDLLNHLLSLNIDKRWRRRAVDRLLDARPLPGPYLDACAGTLDLAVELARRPGLTAPVVGCDFALPMLEGGRRKLSRRSRAGNADERMMPVVPVAADTLCLPFRDGQFAGATVGFGVRNLADLGAGLRELARVLQPGARLVILEFTTPPRQPFRALYFVYFLRVLPAVGRLISRHRSAYAYLPASVLEFPEPPRLAAEMREAGFDDVRWEPLTGGIAAIHSGTRR